MILEGLLMLLVPLGIAAVVAGGVALWMYAAKLAKQRREALWALANEYGLRFDPSRDKDHDDEYAHFEVFRQGDGRTAYNTISGQIELAGSSYYVKMGDFTYTVTTGSGKDRSTTTYRFSYAILHLPYVGVPDLLIRKEGFFDKIASMIGFDDIDFETAEFSRKFLVKSPDKRFAYDIVHPQMMEFLMQWAAPMVDIERDRVCLMDRGKTWKPEEFRRTLQWAEKFFELWPEHVTQDLRSRGRARV